MLFYHIKIVVKQFKTDEFIKSIRSFARRIRKEKGCLGYSVYRLEIPEVKKEDFSVTADIGVLTIRGERKQEEDSLITKTRNENTDTVVTVSSWADTRHLEADI